MGEAVGHDGGSIPHADAAGGYLQLEVAPAAARIFVDGFFMGSAADVMAPLALAAGPHRIEVMADGFQATAFTARVRPHETLRFAIRLDRLAADETRVPSPPASRGIGTDAVPPTEAPAPMPAVAKTLYVIPRCYAGDRPPDASALPAGCRAADVRVIAPGRR